MSWSYVGFSQAQIVNGGTSGSTPALPAGVHGGDLILLAVSAYSSTITQASFTTLQSTTGAAQAADTFLLAYKIAAGPAGSATTDPSTWTVTFGSSTWTGCCIYVIRSTAGVGSVAHSAEYTNASYNATLTAPALTVSNSADATVYGYGGCVSSNGGAGVAITMPGTLSNVGTSAGTAWGNGGVFSVGWGVNVTSPGTATAASALDQLNWAADVTETAAARPAYLARQLAVTRAATR